MHWHGNAYDKGNFQGLLFLVLKDSVTKFCVLGMSTKNIIWSNILAFTVNFQFWYHTKHFFWCISNEVLYGAPKL